MKKREFLEAIRIMLETGEIKVGSQESEYLEALKKIEKDLREYHKNYIIREIEKPECLHYLEANRESWFDFFEYTDGIEEAEYLREIFEEQQLDKIWKNTHREAIT